jgi:hypothetical protein
MNAKQKAAWARQEQNLLTLLTRRQGLAADSPVMSALNKEITTTEEIVKAYREVEALGW